MGLLVLFLFCSFYALISCSQEPEVNTPLGKVIGKTVFHKNIPVITFQGIPYAKPPTGEYRFRKPVSVSKWKSPLNATQLPPACVQYSKYPSPSADFMPGHSEDCLYLNIWTSSSSSKKPVMFFLHGGAFTYGSSRLDTYDGRVLATMDVVLVTINYRLGPLGFLYAGTEEAPGNMGLYDMLEALSWVKSNIQYFGGDEDNVTVFGQSSGAIAINMLMTSPLAQGYFHRVILESGTTANLDGEDNDKDYRNSQKLAEAVGCANDSMSLADAPDEVVECLREVDASTLSKTLSEVAEADRSVYPRYGDEILPQNPRLALIDGNFEGIDTLIGVNNNEGSISVTKARTDVFGYFGKKDHVINKTFGEGLIREIFKEFPDTDAVVEHYLEDLNENDYAAVLYRVQAASGDSERICPSVYVGEKVAAKGNKVYFYFFQHRPSVTPWARWMGVVHTDEVPFVFGYPLRYPGKYTAAELRLSEYMVHMWTHFARTGELSSLKWPLYSQENHVYQSLRSVGQDFGIGPHLQDCNFFRDYLGF